MGYFNRGDAREGKGDDDGATGAGAGECTVTPEMTPAPPEVPPPRGVIPTGGRESSGRGRRGPARQRAPSTGADAREDKGIPPGVYYGAAS